MFILSRLASASTRCGRNVALRSVATSNKQKNAFTAMTAAVATATFCVVVGVSETAHLEEANDETNKTSHKPSMVRKDAKKEDTKEFWTSSAGQTFLKGIISGAQEAKKPFMDQIGNKVGSIKDEVVSMLQFKGSGTKGEEGGGLFGLVDSVTSIIKGGDDREDALDALMSSARNAAQSGGIQDTAGFSELLSLMEIVSDKIEPILKDHFGHIDFSYFTPTSLWYYLEYEDEVKNPSWKRVQHRFHKGIDVRTVEDLNDALMLADLSYADSPEELKEGLKTANIPLELVYYHMDSEPGKPSHFIAVKKGQSGWNNSLEVYVVVRGTKTIADAVTDFILEASDYRGGKAHAGMIDSGKWLAEKHADLFDELRKLSGKKKIKLTLIGHSLGAGAAAIAALELNDKKNVDVNVVGFGCPALLSKELSKSASDYITTVICDSDVIPRMSGATVANIALDIMEYDRYPKLQRDAKLALDDLAENLPDLVTDDRKKTVVDYIDSASEELRKKLLKPKTEERVPPVLFPPGKCVHFYRDGHSISGSIAPCTFFGEIDVTRTMVDDHLISTGYGKIFLDLMRVYHDDENFRFEDRSGTKSN